jgi:signal transduction histidine kinase
VIRNLVNNAIKFTHRNGHVSLKAEEMKDGEIQISVSDDGTGISDDLKKNIFFIGRKQSITGTDGEKGTGLGLILCYEFIKLNGGSIEIESHVGNGSTFIVKLRSGKDS